MNAISARTDVVLIVDDTPANLAYLCDALHDAGYKVLVAMDGPTALERLQLVKPDIILLDAVMPGMDGFQTCQAIKEQPASADIPVIFMTGLVDTEHVLRAFEQGAVDYVTKPVRHEEVLARLRTHLARSRTLKRAQASVESCGRAGFTVDGDGNITWQSPRAREWLDAYIDDHTEPRWEALRTWLNELDSGSIASEATHFCFRREHARLNIHYAGIIDGGERLLLLEEQREGAVTQRLTQRFSLTVREAEVLNWLSAGKTNRDIGEILGMSPRTVNKHLERVYVKLGVETRSAAAAMAVQTMTSPTLAAIAAT